MGQYIVGDTVDHQFTIRVAGVLTDADILPSGTLYVDGVADVAVTVVNAGVGRYKVSYTVPNQSEGADLRVELDSVTNGFGQTYYFDDQVAISGGGGSVDAVAVANEVLSRGVSDTIVDAGTIDRHSLASMILLMSSSSSGSDPSPQIQIKHPDTDAVIHTYQIQVGAGCPVQEIT